jgi:hypothetical protein
MLAENTLQCLHTLKTTAGIVSHNDSPIHLLSFKYSAREIGDAPEALQATI